MYTPTGITNKWTVTDQPIPFRGRMHVIPQGTRISISGTGIHSNPKVWGDNAAEWEPSRWIIEGSDGDGPVKTLQSGRPPSAQVNRRSCGECETDSESTPSSAVQQNGHSIPPSPLAAASAIASGTKTSLGLLKPGKGSFLAFSEGARACLGKRVATVEFIAVIFTLLRRYRVELEEGWSTERVRKILEGRKPDALTRQPPEPIPLRFIRRS
jgi:cytochrome P450